MTREQVRAYKGSPVWIALLEGLPAEDLLPLVPALENEDPGIVPGGGPAIRVQVPKQASYIAVPAVVEVVGELPQSREALG